MSPIPVRPAGGGRPATPPSPGAKPGEGPGQQAPGASEQAKADMVAQNFRLRMLIAENLKRIKHKVIVMSGKGGVGKSTVAVNLAAAYAKAGKKVGLLDLDLTNPNAPHMLGVSEKKPGGTKEGRIHPVDAGDGLHVMSTEFFLSGRDTPIIWRGPIKMNMIQQLLGNVEWGDLDLLVVDLPPGTSDEPLSIAQMLRDADGVILVTTPQAVSVADVRKSVVFCEHVGLKVLGVVENMGTFACPHCAGHTEIFPGRGGDEIAKAFDIPLLARIPLEPGVVANADKGIPYVRAEQQGATADAFRELVEAVRGRLKAEGGA